MIGRTASATSVAFIAAIVLAGCSAASADLDDPKGESLADLADVFEDSEISVSVEPNVAFDSDSAEQWIVTDWETDPERESIEDVTVDDELVLSVESTIDKASGRCGSGTVGDNGASVSFDTKGSDDATGDDIADVACVLFELGVPDSLVTKLDNTRALDGTQSDDWDGITATWNYHPDNGMSLVLEIDD